MFAHSQSGSLEFEQVAKGLVALHRLIKEGKDDSPEGEAIRDALDGPLQVLDPAEKERARWLSEDLYSVSDPAKDTVLKELTPEAHEQLNSALEARRKRHWDEALLVLRQLREYIAPAQMSYFRGSIWLEAGNAHVAAMFFGHASENEPLNANYKALYMHALAESDPPAADKLAQDILAQEKISS